MSFCRCPDLSPRWDAAGCPHSFAATPTSSQLRTVYSSPLIFIQEFIFFAGKQTLSSTQTHWCAAHRFVLFISLWWHHINLTYAGDRGFVHVAQRDPRPAYHRHALKAHSKYASMRNQNQSAFISNRKYR